MQIRVYGTLRSVMGGSKLVEVPAATGSTVRSLLEQLIAQYPGLRTKLYRDGEEFVGGVTILVNGRSIGFLGGLNTRVEESDRLAMFPPVGGG